MFFVFTLGFGTFMNVQEAEGALLVNDINNTLQNTKTAISTATNAVNTASQVANDVRNLASMSPDGLLAHYLGISKELSNTLGVYNAYNGLMNATQTAEQAWNGTFQSAESFLSGDTSALKGTAEGQKNMYSSVDKTYRDSMNTARQVSDTRGDMTNLQNALNKVANANGAKEVAQANGQVSSIIAETQIKGLQTESQLLGITAADAEIRNQDAMRAWTVNQDSIIRMNQGIESDRNYLEQGEQDPIAKSYPSNIAAEMNAYLK
jgi:P-type conjugative transfer protein TrbJ